MSCPRDENGGFKIVTRVRDRYRYPRYQIPILNGKNDFIAKSLISYRLRTKAVRYVHCISNIS